jgi:hypothetical protein
MNVQNPSYGTTMPERCEPDTTNEKYVARLSDNYCPNTPDLSIVPARGNLGQSGEGARDNGLKRRICPYPRIR